MSASAREHRVCIVGAGSFAQMHADALSCAPGAELVAVCDIDGARAQRFADHNRLQHAFTTVEDAISSGAFDFAHIVVYPDRHVAVARQLIDAHINVLIEKPMGLSKAECSELVGFAHERGVQIGVNHNYLFYPAYLKLREAVTASSLGPLQHLIIAYNGPAEWLTRVSREGRWMWMLQHPVNLAYDSAIHFLAQVYDLAGPVVDAHTTVSGRHDRGQGRYFFDTWQTSLVCERATAQVLFSYGAYRVFQLVAICQDGMMTAELDQNRFTALDRTRWPEREQPIHLARKVAAQELGSALGNLAREADSALHPRSAMDPYFTCMKDSVVAFHRGPAEGQPNVDGAFGAQVVAMCDAATATVADDHREALSVARRPPSGHCDAVVLGGTTFLGASLVEQLVSAGLTVLVMAADTAGLPPLFHNPQVHLVEGDEADDARVSAALTGARFVVQLRQQSIERLAQACLRAGAERLVYVGSIAPLYLGDPRAIITESTPADPRVRERGPGPSGEARGEEILLRYAREESLPVCIVRPGIAFGAGGTPFHPGLGIWRGEIHCIGWNAGTNPLPLVLGTDVATAIRLALDSEVAVGKSYNLVGDVRLSARECVRELSAALRRPLTFHPVHPMRHQALGASKWLAKRVLRGERTPFPSYRMVKSNACLSAFDCSEVKRELGWSPLADRAEFIDDAFRVY
jgi:predicted dehydrogenase/nucleoside-diphosphate-sugar epimerase